jgi:hypothetical protein
MSLPPHFIDEKNKEVVFHLKGGYPVTMAIPTIKEGGKILVAQWNTIWNI